MRSGNRYPWPSIPAPVLKVVVLMIAAACLAGARSPWQEPTTGVRLSGRVTGASDRVLLLKNDPRGLTRTASPGSDGRFEFTNVAPGIYSVGMEISRAGIRINPQ